MSHLEVVSHLRTLASHPLAVVVVLALIAAALEQRIARKRTPDFSTAWRDVDGKPPTVPKAKPPR